MEQGDEMTKNDKYMYNSHIILGVLLVLCVCMHTLQDCIF